MVYDLILIYHYFIYELITGCRIVIQGFFTTPGEYVWHI